MSATLEALSCTGRNPLSLWSTQGSVSRVYDNTSRCYVLVISNDQRRSSIERSFGPFYRYVLVQVRPQDDREFSIDVSVEAPHSRRIRLCISTAFRVPSVNDVHVQIPLGLGRSNRPGQWLSLLVDSELLVHAAFAGKLLPHGISSVRVNGCCAVRKVLLLRDALQVDRDFGSAQRNPQFPIHPSHEFPPGVKRLSVRLGFGPNRLDALPAPSSLPSPSVRSFPASPRVTGVSANKPVPTLPLARVAVAVARRSSAQAVADIKSTARLLFEQIGDSAPPSARPSMLRSPALTPCVLRRSPQLQPSPQLQRSPQLRRSPSTFSLRHVEPLAFPQGRHDGGLQSARSLQGRVDEAFNELLRNSETPSSAAKGKNLVLLKMGDVLYDPENDRYYDNRLSQN